MGNYLDSRASFTAYSEVYKSPYFVDKSAILEKLIPRIGISEKYVCITRPRRFGKSVTANMVAAFFSRGCDSREIFDNLKIAEAPFYTEHVNRYPVISISFNRLPRRCSSFEDYISRIERKLTEDLVESYPQAKVDPEDAVWDILKAIYDTDPSARFIFVLDEWDFIFHKDFISGNDKKAYIDFLSSLLKDQPYVDFVYMTGILPIASICTAYRTQESADSFVDPSGESLQAVFPADGSYSSGSELNMFLEYTMASEELFSSDFGFTEAEVSGLYNKYLRNQQNPEVTLDGLKIWYDGYCTKSGERVYNPRSVAASLTNNNLGNYWTSAGPYDEIYYYNLSPFFVRKMMTCLRISAIPIISTITRPPYAMTLPG